MRPMKQRRGGTVYEPERRDSIRALSADVGPVIYAVKLEDGVIKIGHTARIYDRMKHFGGMKRLLGITPGTRDDEAKLHRSLSEHVHHGREYYHSHPDVIEVINGWREAYGLKPL